MDYFRCLKYIHCSTSARVLVLISVSPKSTNCSNAVEMKLPKPLPKYPVIERVSTTSASEWDWTFFDTHCSKVPFIYLSFFFPIVFCLPMTCTRPLGPLSPLTFVLCPVLCVICMQPPLRCTPWHLSAII